MTMDNKQKELLNSANLAAAINFTDLIECGRLEKLVSKQKIEDIKDKYYSDYSKNVVLLGAIQESDLPDAFDEFLDILNLTQAKNDQVLKLVVSLRDASPKRIFSRIIKKFVDIRAKHPHPKYPLGMDSGDISSSSIQSRDPQGEELIPSPYKENHQATVIGSGSSMTDSSNKHSSTPEQGISIPKPRLQGLSPTLPMAPTALNSSGYQIKQKPMSRTQASQTPIKPQELSLLAQNMSLTDTSAGSETNEPVVCWHPYAHAQSSGSHQESHRSASPYAHQCYPSYASSESDSSSDSLIIDSDLMLDASITMAITKDGANTMAVKTATTCHDDEEEDYKMTSNPRGPCLIVNNIDFEAEMFPTRKGSDEDARRFDDIFRQLGFKVIMRRNQTADQMRKLFKDVASECKPEHDALFVFILSHGSEHGIYGVDGFEVYLESEIISCFDNRNCKTMIGKPKVFVIQACRGRAKDCGSNCSEGGDMTDSIAWPSVVASPTVRTSSQENRVPASWLPSTGPSEGKKRKHPIRTDMLLVFSCLAGFVSVRNELAGSWLGVALAYFIMTHAHERDLLRILNLVASDVIQRESSHGHIQSIEIRQLGWTKNLYFNPGIYKDDSN